MNTVQITPNTPSGEIALKQYILDMQTSNVKRFGISRLKYHLFTRWANSLINEEYNENPLMITITQLKGNDGSSKEREQIKKNVLNIFKQKYGVLEDDLCFNFVK